MALTPRTKKYTDYAYLITNPASENDVRAQMDGAVDEVFTTVDSALTTTDTNIGTLASLTTSIKTSIVLAINSIVSSITSLTTLTTTTISTGFAAGWSGTVTIRKSFDNLVQIAIDIQKTSDILGDSPITIPLGTRPLSTVFQAIHITASGGATVGGNTSNLDIAASGLVSINAGGTTTNARRVLCTIMYYSA